MADIEMPLDDLRRYVASGKGEGYPDPCHLIVLDEAPIVRQAQRAAGTAIAAKEDAKLLDRYRQQVGLPHD